MVKIIEVSGESTDFDDVLIGNEIYYKDDIWLVISKEMGKLNMEFITIERCIKEPTNILSQIFFGIPFFTLTKERRKIYKHEIPYTYVIEWTKFNIEAQENDEE